MNLRIHVACLLAVVASVLAGCGLEITHNPDHYDSHGELVPLSQDGNATSVAFGVPVDYKEAYRRAKAYAETCRTSKTFGKPSWSVVGYLGDEHEASYVHIGASHFSPDFERIDVSDAGDSQASVKVIVRSMDTWDQRELDSARRSIESGVPACR